MSKNTNASNPFVTAEEIQKFHYLAEKPVSDLHETLSTYIQEVSGIELSPKQVQAVLSIHGTYQKSEANKNRAGYKARTAESIRNGGATTAERFQQIVAAEQASAKEAAKAEAAKEAAKTETAEAPKPRTRRSRATKTEVAAETAEA